MQKVKVRYEIWYNSETDQYDTLRVEGTTKKRVASHPTEGAATANMQRIITKPSRFIASYEVEE